MQSLGRTLSSALIGAMVGGGLGFFNSLILMLTDNSNTEEAIVFSFIPAIVCAAIGFCIGLAVGGFDLGVLPGAGAGVAGLLVAILLFVIAFGGNGQQSSIFQQNWRVLLTFMTIPTVLTGVASAVIKNSVFKR